VDTFLTALYVMVDNLCHTLTQKQRHPGPSASLSPTEVVTLAIFARWVASVVSETSTATQTPTCATLFQPCPIARNSTAVCGFSWSSSRMWPCSRPFPLWRPSRDVAERVLPLLQTLLQSSQLNYGCFEYREQYKGRPNIL
jgi:hypothetical protein